MPVIALLVAPVLACFVGGFAAAAARPAPAPSTPAAPPEWPDNIVRFDPARRRRA